MQVRKEGPGQRESRAVIQAQQRPQPTLWVTWSGDDISKLCRVGVGLYDAISIRYWMQDAPGRGVILSEAAFFSWGNSCRGLAAGRFLPGAPTLWNNKSFGSERGSGGALQHPPQHIIGILQTRCYYPVTQVKKLNFGECIKFSQAIQLVTTSWFKLKSFGS